MVFTPVSLGPDTDDEETLVDAEVYINGECEVCVCSFSLRCAHCRAPIHVRKETHIYTRILYIFASEIHVYAVWPSFAVAVQPTFKDAVCLVRILYVCISGHVYMHSG